MTTSRVTFTCSKSTIETIEKDVNFEDILHLFLVFLLLTLNKQMLAVDSAKHRPVCIMNPLQVNALFLFFTPYEYFKTKVLPMFLAGRER